MKLLTWNIQWGRGIDGCVDLDRIIAHAKRFADFDVLCLQEVSAAYPELPGNDGSDQFEEIAKRLPGFTAVQGIAVDVPGPSGERRRFGNMLLSRFPVLQVFRHSLPWPADPESKSMQRIALEATLDTPLGLIRVTTTHLEYYSQKQRRAQVERLRQLHQEAFLHALSKADSMPSDGPFFRLPRGGPAILCGDFNLRPDTEEKRLIASPIDDATPAYCDAWEVLHPLQAQPPTVAVHGKNNRSEPPFTFDYIFVSEDLAARVKDVRVDETTDASDHQPMLIELHE